MATAQDRAVARGDRAVVTTVAVLGGTGAMGRGLALRWARAGFDLVVGSRDADRAAAAARGISPWARGLANPDAVAAADVVVLAVPPAAHDSTLLELVPWFRPGAALLDVVVPLRWDARGGPLPVAGRAAAETARELLPPAVAVAAGFHSVSATALTDVGHPVLADVLVCGDGPAKAAVRPLVESIPGARFVDAGDLQIAGALEAMTALVIRLGKQHRSKRAGLRVGGLPGADLGAGHLLTPAGLAELRHDYPGQTLAMAVVDATVDGRPLRGLLIAHGRAGEVDAQVAAFRGQNPEALIETYRPEDPAWVRPPRS